PDVRLRNPRPIKNCKIERLFQTHELVHEAPCRSRPSYHLHGPKGKGWSITISAGHPFARKAGAIAPLPPPRKRIPLCLRRALSHPDAGTGLGASHQTGWTSLVARLITTVCSGSPKNPMQRAARLLSPSPLVGEGTSLTPSPLEGEGRGEG